MHKHISVKFIIHYQVYMTLMTFSRS